ncbi:hypothetical protein F441_09018 [Phytophthora nicotianae CJ01A1]|uniref:Uncharacterized protein n=5 Tax=Phytophthora nicotianae TaxID=4792 RepID=W2Q866_PHYN3|nr:hypothetical protein PPTG_11587 [Phytophthora nicotianae INRA-310]ETK86497.1 hypothetical protein L915_08874 [Phytophthora nicotianae]ETO75268.1 hypothetical protein F444_09114 [Phytophthora nicotianae P1976]ETP16361.1 hypothetical protein F441_09018 [Phytophthora nicotianae CJ01A1]ETP44410.1 hypothetical protein F442_08991 [Phytophthora nicotianae P10297]KUF90789.1 Neutral ceramidase [Phytophthora nicotianae]
MPRGVRREDLNAAGEGSPSEGKLRQRFGRDEDHLLVLQVSVDAPYNARHGAIGETWDAVAERLNDHPDFHMRPIKGTTAKARFDTIVARHRLWMEKASVEGSDEIDSPFRKIMNELVKEIDARPKGNARLPEDGSGEEQEEGTTRGSRTSSRLGKRRASSDTFEEEPARREVLKVPKASGTKQTQSQPSDSEPAVTQETVANEEPAPSQQPVTGDLVTVQQAMAELIKMQHAFATGPSEIHIHALEKMNEARIREEEEKTKQRGIELQIEIQRTKRRQLELEFEREERKKDREEHAKLIASLVQRLEPKRD